MAAIADAVSCPATATTGTAPSPVARCNAGVSVPTTSPGKTMRPNWSAFKPNDSSKRWLKARLCASSKPEVLAMVYSHTISPVSIYDSASGVNKNFFAP